MIQYGPVAYSAVTRTCCVCRGEIVAHDALRASRAGVAHAACVPRAQVWTPTPAQQRAAEHEED